jgi:uncharacterized protein (TIGR02217 family)
MAQVFPESPAPNFGYTLTPRWDTMIKRVRSGAEQRRGKLTYAQYDAELLYDVLTQSEMVDEFYEFYMAHKGALTAFWFYDIISHAHKGLYVGTGDGSTEVFDLPGKSTSSQTIYVDGVEQTVTTDYVILTGGGDGNADRVDFVTPPSEGQVVTCDFTGYLRCRMRFEEDEMDRTLFSVALFKTGLKLKGLAPA